MSYFYDWLSTYQDFSEEMPIISDTGQITINLETGETSSVRQQPLFHEGSYSTSIRIKVNGSRIMIEGNPSRYGRKDNLFGYTKLDDCFTVYNRILSSLNLPRFTKCTKLDYIQGKDDSKVITVSDGAIITRLDLTSNFAVGEDCERDYIKGLATQRYRNSLPRLHTDGNTCDWLSKLGNARFIYPSVYNKAVELELHSLPRFKRKYGENSKETQYIKSVIDYCKTEGIVRLEQKVKSPFLRKSNLSYWGLFSEAVFTDIQKPFIDLDRKLKVEKMTIENVTEKLLKENIVNDVRAANCTAGYFYQWMHGARMDVTKTHIRVHRARLRKIGIDIASPCDMHKISPIFVKTLKTIERKAAIVPSWYERPNFQTDLRMVN